MAILLWSGFDSLYRGHTGDSLVFLLITVMLQVFVQLCVEFFEEMVLPLLLRLSNPWQPNCYKMFETMLKTTVKNSGNVLNRHQQTNLS